MEVVVDRVEGEFIVVEVSKGVNAYISLSLLPSVSEGDVINISIDKEKRLVKEEDVEELMNKLFED